MNLLVVDNFDSFTYMLVDYLRQAGARCRVVRNNDSWSVLTQPADGVVLSPGPGRPADAGQLMAVIDHYHRRIPMLGVCLGHQAIGTYFGAQLTTADRPMHGKVSVITTDPADPLFAGLATNRFGVTRYHSLVLQALLKIGKRAIKGRLAAFVCGAAFAALSFTTVPFPLVILTAGLIGAATVQWAPEWLGKHHTAAGSTPLAPTQQLIALTVRTVSLWSLVWALPLAMVYLLLGPHHVLWQIGLFFSRLAVVTFGGAYAVLAYMAQAAVSGFGWLAPGEMADGLGMAETTPGPLIMVTQFVGFLAAWRHPGLLSPLVAGLLGAGLTTWVTFTPCFLWIFACAPWMERLERAAHLQGALAAITAAVVGVIANLALWFALHVLFSRISEVGLPDLASLDWRAALIAALAAVLVFGLKRGIVMTMAVCAATGATLSFLPLG